MVKTTRFPFDHRFSHGGQLRKKRRGRKQRPLSTKHPIHLVFKADGNAIGSGFRTLKRYRLTSAVLQQYSRRFFIKVEQVSFQFNHIHLVVRTSRRSGFLNFLRVFSGQVAQRFAEAGLLLPVSEIELLLREVTDTPGARGGSLGLRQKQLDPDRPRPLWLHRPFTRVVLGARARKTIRDYVQLNEQEARGKIPYRKTRLRGLTDEERKILWSFEPLSD